MPGDGEYDGVGVNLAAPSSPAPYVFSHNVLANQKLPFNFCTANQDVAADILHTCTALSAEAEIPVPYR